MRRRFVARLNHPRGRIFDRLRMEATTAYMICCAIAAIIGSCAFAFGMTWHGRLPTGPDLEQFVMLATFWTVAAAIAEMVLAGPFIAAATWLADRTGIDNAAYYIGLGGLSAGAMGLLLFGLPSENALLFAIVMPMAFPIYGASWGAAWWYLHRRWKVVAAPDVR